MNGESLGGNYNQGDNEYEQLAAQDALNAEYGNELGNIDAELAAKKEQDQQIGAQAVAAAGQAEPQVTKIPRITEEEQAQLMRNAAAEDAAGVPMPEASLTAKVENVDAALTDPDAQRATDAELTKEYNEIEGKEPTGPTPDQIAGADEAAGQEAA